MKKRILRFCLGIFICIFFICVPVIGENETELSDGFVPVLPGYQKTDGFTDVNAEINDGYSSSERDYGVNLEAETEHSFSNNINETHISPIVHYDSGENSETEMSSEVENDSRFQDLQGESVFNSIESNRLDGGLSCFFTGNYLGRTVGVILLVLIIFFIWTPL